MNKIIITTALALLTATTTTVQAKDKHKHHHHDWHHSQYSDWDHHHDGDKDHDRYRDGRSERSRTIYVIERGRPVERVVYLDSGGRYYRRVNGLHVYLRQNYFESSPARYYTPSGERRISISLPF